MKLGRNFKTMSAWVALVAAVPQLVITVRAVGVNRTLSAAALLAMVFIVWRWRSFLNYVRNTETMHSVEILNAQGDAQYRRTTSLLPLFWPIKTSEVFIHLSNKDGVIEAVDANCPIEWTRRDKQQWRGIAHPPRHMPALWRICGPVGTRIEIRSSWSKAFLEEPHDLVIACGERKSSRLTISLKWRKEARPSEIFAESTPFPVSLVRTGEMVNTSRLPWQIVGTGNVDAESDGSVSYVFNVEEPRRSYMYRVRWRYS